MNEKRKVSLDKAREEFEILKHNCGFWIRKSNPEMTSEEVLEELKNIALSYVENPGDDKPDFEERAVVMALSMLYDIQKPTETRDFIYNLRPEVFEKTCEEKGVDMLSVKEKVFLMMAAEIYREKIETLKKRCELNII